MWCSILLEGGTERASGSFRGRGASISTSRDAAGLLQHVDWTAHGDEEEARRSGGVREVSCMRWWTRTACCLNGSCASPSLWVSGPIQATPAASLFLVCEDGRVWEDGRGTSVPVLRTRPERRRRRCPQLSCQACLCPMLPPRTLPEAEHQAWGSLLIRRQILRRDSWGCWLDASCWAVARNFLERPLDGRVDEESLFGMVYASVPSSGFKGSISHEIARPPTQ